MSGNVWEWCWDVDSDRGRAYRCYCGGSYGYYGFCCTVSSENNYLAKDQDDNVGFRIVCSASN